MGSRGAERNHPDRDLVFHDCFRDVEYKTLSPADFPWDVSSFSRTVFDEARFGGYRIAKE